MKRTVIATVLAVCLAGSLVWGFTNMSNLNNEKETTATLTQMVSQQEQKLKQEEEYISHQGSLLELFDKEVGLLQNELNEGSVIIKEYEEQLESLQRENDQYRAALESQRKINDQYRAAIAQIRQEAEQAQQNEIFNGLLNLIFSLF